MSWLDDMKAMTFANQCGYHARLVDEVDRQRKHRKWLVKRLHALYDKYVTVYAGYVAAADSMDAGWARAEQLEKKAALAQKAWANAGVRAQEAEAERDALKARIAEQEAFVAPLSQVWTATSNEAIEVRHEEELGMAMTWRGPWMCEGCGFSSAYREDPHPSLMASDIDGFCHNRMIPHDRRAPDPEKAKLVAQIEAHMDTIRTQSLQLAESDSEKEELVKLLREARVMLIEACGEICSAPPGMICSHESCRLLSRIDAAVLKRHEEAEESLRRGLSQHGDIDRGSFAQYVDASAVGDVEVPPPLPFKRHEEAQGG